MKHTKPVCRRPGIEPQLTFFLKKVHDNWAARSLTKMNSQLKTVFT